MSISISGSGAITGASTSYSFDQAVSIAGTVTYEDVSNVDSIGVITARNGIHALGSGNLVGIGTSSPESRLHIYGTHNSHIRMTNTSSDALDLIGDANRSGQDQSILTIKSRWNGTDVARINFKTGSDTTDKDDGDITFQTKNSGSSIAERLRITSAGLVGVNVVPTQQKLTIDVNGSGTAQASFDGINICNTDTTTNNGAAIVFGQAIAGNSYARIGVINSDRSGGSEDQDIFFGTLGGGNYAERMRIDSLGRVGINTTGFADSATAINIKNGATGNEHTFVDIECNTNESCRVRFSEDGSTYPGEIRYTTLSHELQFYVNSAQRMFIDSTGRIGINTDAFNDAAEALRVNNPSGQDNAMLTIKSNNNGTGQSILNFGDDDFNEGRIIYDHSDNTMRFRTNDDERMIINGSGNVMVATDSTQGGHNLSVRGDSLTPMVLRRNGSNGGVLSIMKESNFVGSIVVDGSSTTYNTSSDYRLKENVTLVSDGITRVKQLAPKRFNFIIEPGKTVDGFLAHEAATVVPEAVTGEYNAVDEDNNPVYQQIDQSKFVPLLTAALQEAISEIESLKARVDALEGN